MLVFIVKMYTMKTSRFYREHALMFSMCFLYVQKHTILCQASTYDIFPYVFKHIKNTCLNFSYVDIEGICITIKKKTITHMHASFKIRNTSTY